MSKTEIVSLILLIIFTPLIVVGCVWFLIKRSLKLGENIMEVIFKDINLP